MFAKAEIDSFLLDERFWDQCLLGLIVLLVAAGALALAPRLIDFVLRRRQDTLGNYPPADGASARESPESEPEKARESPAAIPSGGQSVASPGGRAAVRARQPRDKRKHVRRQGPPMPILLSPVQGLGTPRLCRVVNRSRGGLGIVADTPLARGTIIKVRPVEAPEDVAWVQLEVRNCHQQQNEWHLGCRFTENLAWSVILLFG